MKLVGNAFQLVVWSMLNLNILIMPEVIKKDTVYMPESKNNVSLRWTEILCCSRFCFDKIRLGLYKTFLKATNQKTVLQDLSLFAPPALTSLLQVFRDTALCFRCKGGSRRLVFRTHPCTIHMYTTLHFTALMSDRKRVGGPFGDLWLDRESGMSSSCADGSEGILMSTPRG